MNSDTKTTVKISNARPADWAVAKAKAMHSKLAHGCDKQAERHAEKMAAKAEKAAAKCA